MMQTLDFLPTVWKSNSIKEELLNNLQCEKKEFIDIGVHRLKFDFKYQTIYITCSAKEYIFMSKMIPLEMSFEILINLINKDFDNKNNKWDLL
ncbi:hypothetical protein [Inconstantimicrobium mannanitabidum]|uniref:Uncharacterized protein n=1 Tax=Inconstantimicrobium mannanitabidum TaxID=1604901 RepID=A0ACB5RBG6_9CLOT|nr:hypothetical protein [Clostridium sp. TW13]GKX66394.1 hypothetical protein rsdtw13_16520 [Clostridium sp. TW13]